MRIKCGDHWHHASPTALSMIIEAFQEGELTFTRSSQPRCVRYAFTTERVNRFKRLYKGNDIIFDYKVIHHGSSRVRRPTSAGGPPLPDTVA